MILLCIATKKSIDCLFPHLFHIVLYFAFSNIPQQVKHLFSVTPFGCPLLKNSFPKVIERYSIVKVYNTNKIINDSIS